MAKSAGNDTTGQMRRILQIPHLLGRNFHSLENGYLREIDTIIDPESRFRAFSSLFSVSLRPVPVQIYNFIPVRLPGFRSRLDQSD